MAYSESLAERIRQESRQWTPMDSKKMFGGLAFFTNGHMCVGVWRDAMIARVGPEQAPATLQQPYVSPFAPAGRPMTGWVMVSADGLAEDRDVRMWIDRSIAFTSTLPPK